MSKRRNNLYGVKTGLAALGLLLARALAGSPPGALVPPRLLGLGVSNGGHPFLGDTRELATVSPNGDGFRERALIRFGLDRAATVRMQVVATGAARSPVRVVWQTKRRLAAGPHPLVWKPGRGTPSRTYLLRFVVRARDGSSRVY